MFRKGLASLLIAAAATAALWADIASAQVRSAVANNENRVALVIGNSQYQNSAALPNPANDAQAISQLLNTAGFEVVMAFDLSRDTMRQTVGEFASRISQKGPNTVALVYYAGHGLQVEGENYLIPVDAKFQSETDVVEQGVKLADLMDALEAAPSKMRIVILDACRNNPFGDTNGKGLAIVDAPSGTIVAYSTAPGTEAYDGRGRHSPYAAAFMRTVKQPNLPIEQVFKKIRLLVNETTGSKQTPWESSSLTSDFVFFSDAGSAAPAYLPQRVALAELGARPVRAAYDVVIAEDRIEYYQEFVRLYPADPLCDHIRLLLLRRQQMLAWQIAKHKGPFGKGGHGPVAGIPQNQNGKVIPFPNGNTGINGTGKPKPVIPFPNGNTGINGTGIPGNTQGKPSQSGNTGINPNAGRPQINDRPIIKLPQTGNQGINPKAGRPQIKDRPIIKLPQTANQGINPNAGRPVILRPLNAPQTLRPVTQPQRAPASSRFVNRGANSRIVNGEADLRR